MSIAWMCPWCQRGCPSQGDMRLHEAECEMRPDPKEDLRDKFAMAVMPAVTRELWGSGWDKLAEAAYQIADAMLDRRKKQ